MDIIAIERKTLLGLLERISSLESQFDKSLEEIKKDRLYNSKEVKEILGIGSTTLQSYRDTGKLPFIKIGKTIRYKWSDLKILITNHRVLPNGNP